MMQQFTEADLERARTRWDVIAGDVPLKRKGRELVGLCPFHSEKTASFAIVPDKGFYHCQGCGAHGTAIDYLMHVRGLDFVQAVRELLGMPQQQAKEAAAVPGRREPDRHEEVEQRVDEILAACGPITPRTAGHLYLWSRGIASQKLNLLDHPALYCHEIRKPLPAIVAPITSSDERITAIQRIWLSDVWVPGEAPDSRAPLQARKKTLGVMGDGAVRLRPASALLGLAEGVETAGAAMQLNRGIPAWAICGASRFGFPAHWRERTEPGERPTLWIPPDEEPPPGANVAWVEARAPSVWIPREVRRLLIYGDNGRIGRIVAEYAAAYWSRQGLDAAALFPDAGFGDFNDQLLGVAA